MQTRGALIWAIILLIALIVIFAVTASSWFVNMTPNQKTIYWVVGGIILLVIAIILLYFVFSAPKTEFYKIK